MVKFSKPPPLFMRIPMYVFMRIPISTLVVSIVSCTPIHAHTRAHMYPACTPVYPPYMYYLVQAPLQHARALPPLVHVTG